MMENLALFRTNLLPNAVYEVTIGGIQCASHRGSPSPPRACSSPSALQTSLEICCAFAASFCWQTLLLSAISQWKFNEEWAAIIRPRRPPQPPIISLLCNQIIIIIIIMDISISFQISLNSLHRGLTSFVGHSLPSTAMCWLQAVAKTWLWSQNFGVAFRVHLA